MVPAGPREDLPGIEYTDPGCLACRFRASYRHWQALPRHDVGAVVGALEAVREAQPHRADVKYAHLALRDYMRIEEDKS